MSTAFGSSKGENVPSLGFNDEAVLLVAAETLAYLPTGLNAESASHAALSILKHTDFEAVAVTSERSLLAFSGHDREGALEALGKEMAEALLSGKPQTMDRPVDFLSADATLQRGIIAPIRASGKVAGSLILGYTGPTEDWRQRQKLAVSLAKVLGSQIELGEKANRKPTVRNHATDSSSQSISLLTQSLISLCQNQPEIFRQLVENTLELFHSALPLKGVGLEDSVRSKESPISELGTQREQSGQNLGRLPVEKSGRTVLLDVETIVFAQARGGHFFINTRDESYHVRFSLRELERRLSSPFFFRCHRSFLVNLRQVDEVLPMFNGTYLLYVDDLRKTEIPVSRQQAKQLRRLLGV